MRYLSQSTTPAGSSIRIGSGADAVDIYSPLRPEIKDISSLLDYGMPIMFAFASVILFVMFLYAGYTFMMSEGKADKISTAQNTFIYGIVGFALLFLAFFITRVAGYIFGLDAGGIFK